MFNKRPIHIAIINKNVEILGILLKHPDIDVIAVDEIFIFKNFYRISFRFFWFFICFLKRPLQIADDNQIRELLLQYTNK